MATLFWKLATHNPIPAEVIMIVEIWMILNLKVIIVEETEYDDVVECKHSYNERCHTTYTTDFEPQQVILTESINIHPMASADIFPGEGKNFLGGSGGKNLLLFFT